MDKFISDAIGKHVVEPIIDVVDVDGVVRRVDLNGALDKIDWNAQLDRIDLNAQLERVDINRLMQRLDINDLVIRSDVGKVLAQSTTGILTQVLDALRTQVVLLDLLVYRFSSGCRFGQRGRLPPKPNRSSTTTDDDNHYPKGRSNKAIAVQGRYTGFISKALAIFADGALVTFSFAVLLIVFEVCWMILTSAEDRKVIDKDNRYVLLLFCGYWFSYFFGSVLLGGQTLGMAIVGIRVISVYETNPQGQRRRRRRRRQQWKLGLGQVFMRTLLLPLSTTLCPVLGLFGLVRQDGRMFHDYMASTGIIYQWHAKLAKMREKTIYHQTSSMTTTTSNNSSNSSTTSAGDDDYWSEEDELDRMEEQFTSCNNDGMHNRRPTTTTPTTSGGGQNTTPSMSLLPSRDEEEERRDGYTTFDNNNNNV